MEVFDFASDLVKRTHEVVMGRSNEQFGPALELSLSFSLSGQDQALDAAAILVNPIKRFIDRSRLEIYVQSTQEPQQIARRGLRLHRIELLCELRRQLDVRRQ